MRIMQQELFWEILIRSNKNAGKEQEKERLFVVIV